MKKLILIIPVLLTLPSYADIASNANSATCDSGTIGATSGSTGLEANWNANTITIDWYNGDTKITTNTCTYDGAVTIPTTPTKAGYTFNGWRVRTAAATPKQCWEIEDDTECLSTTGCAYSYSYSRCHVENHNCPSITNATDCEHSGDSDGYCYWNTGTCGYLAGGGGGND